jgi:hypothetical protein
VAGFGHPSDIFKIDSALLGNFFYLPNVRPRCLPRMHDVRFYANLDDLVKRGHDPFVLDHLMVLEHWAQVFLGARSELAGGPV